MLRPVVNSAVRCTDDVGVDVGVDVGQESPISSCDRPRETVGPAFVARTYGLPRSDQDGGPATVSW